jgi:sec-independent protein translocase protein TatA
MVGEIIPGFCIFVKIKLLDMVPQMFFLGMVGGWQLVIILVVVLILFGGKKIPELMKGLGEGIREFNKAKSEKDDESDNKTDKK